MKSNVSINFDKLNKIIIFLNFLIRSIGEVSNRMLYLINEKGLSQYQAWNESSVLLTTCSKIYINVFVINVFLSYVHSNKCVSNQRALSDLLELYLLYGICDTFSANVLRVNFY